MSKEKKGSLFYVKVFLAFFAVIFLIALVIRVFGSFSNSHFTNNSFNILIIADNYVGVMGLDKNDEKFYSVVVTEDLDTIKRRNILIQSINFGIPIHAYIEFPKGFEAEAPTKSFFSLNNIKTMIGRMDIKKENISLIDWVNIYRLSEEIKNDSVQVKTYAAIDDLRKLFPSEEESFFRNSDISNRKTSLQVINSTSINGLGNRVGDMLSRFGFNVVSVTTASSSTSGVYYSDENALQDANLVSESFGFPVSFTNEYSIADVTLVIGEDSELLLEDIAY